MEPYRPLSKRGVPDPDLDTLHEAVEPWMVEPLIAWLQRFLWRRPDYSGNRPSDIEFVEDFEMAHRVRVPFDRSDRFSTAKDVEVRIREG